MPLKCPKCQSGVIKKNGTIHNGKQITLKDLTARLGKDAQD